MFIPLLYYFQDTSEGIRPFDNKAPTAHACTKARPEHTFQDLLNNVCFFHAWVSLEHKKSIAGNKNLRL